MRENDILRQVLAACKVHTALGLGLLAAVYEAALAHELRQAGLRVEVGYRLDLLVAGNVIVKLKSVESLHPTPAKQLTTYLRLSKLKLGLLLNFNVSP